MRRRGGQGEREEGEDTMQGPAGSGPSASPPLFPFPTPLSAPTAAPLPVHLNGAGPTLQLPRLTLREKDATPV